MIMPQVFMVWDSARCIRVMENSPRSITATSTPKLPIAAASVTEATPP